MRVARALAGDRSSPCSAQLGIPYAIEQPSRLGRDASRPRARSRCSATPGSAADAASSSRSFALRSPASSVARSTSSRDGCAGRAVVDPARVEEETEKLRGAHIPALVELRAEPRPDRGGARAAPDDGAKRVGSRGASRRRRRTWRRAGVPRGRTHARRARGIRAARRTRSRRRGCRRGARADDACGRLQPPRPGRVAVLDYAVPGRGRSTSCSCSGSRREPSAPRPAVAAPRRRVAARARRPRSSGRTPSRATAISSTRRARGRRSGSCSSARRPATKAFRVSRARSGTTCSALFARADVAARRRAAGRCPA